MADRAPIFRPPAAQTREQRNAAYFAQRPSSTQRGYDRIWQRCRDAFLAHEPLCRRCLLEQRVSWATEVHHIRSIAVAPELRLAWPNLMPVCRPCHMAIEAERR